MAFTNCRARHERMTGIRGQGYRPRSDCVKARSARCKKLTDQVWAGLRGVIEAARG
jgi:hypothetical protein